jgi:hypothetical protein
MNKHDRSTYEKDLAVFIKNQTDLIKQQVLLEIITIACECDNFEQFKKVLYARALGMMKQFEDQGMLKPGTTEKAAKGENIDE